jgi:hypothetical protein
MDSREMNNMFGRVVKAHDDNVPERDKWKLVRNIWVRKEWDL